MHTYCSLTQLPLRLLGTSLAVIGLAGALASPSARANGLECLSDDEAVIKCEALHIGMSGRIKPREPVCVENCAVCGVLDLTEFETN